MKKRFLKIWAIVIMIGVILSVTGCDSSNKNLGGSSMITKETEIVSLKSNYTMLDEASGYTKKLVAEINKSAGEGVNNFHTVKMFKCNYGYLYDTAMEELDYLTVADSRQYLEHLVRAFLEAKKLKGELDPDFVKWVSKHGLALDDNNFLGVPWNGAWNTNNELLTIAIVKVNSDYLVLAGPNFTMIKPRLELYYEGEQPSVDRKEFRSDGTYSGIDHIVTKLQSLGIKGGAEVTEFYIDGYFGTGEETSAVAVVKKFLKEKGIDTKKYMYFPDGAIANENVRVNPNLYVTLLDYEGFSAAFIVEDVDYEPYLWFYDGVDGQGIIQHNESSESSEASSDSVKTDESDDSEVGFEPIPLMKFNSWLRNNGLIMDSNIMGEYSFMYDNKYIYIPLSSRELNKENFMEVFLSEIEVTIDSAKSQDGQAYTVVIGDDAEQLLGGEIAYTILTVHDSQSPPGSVSVAVVIGRPSDIDTILEWYHEE